MSAVELLLFFISFILILIILIEYLSFGVLFLVKSRQKETSSPKRFYFGIATFSMSYGLMTFFFFISDSVKTGTLPAIFTGFATFDFGIWWKVAAFFGILGFTAILFVLELDVIKTKFILTIMAIVGSVFAMILPVSESLAIDARFIITITIPYGACAVLGIYSYLIYKSHSEIRKKSIGSLVGILIVFIGFAINTVLGQQVFWFLGPFSFYIALALQMIGPIIFALYNLVY